MATRAYAMDEVLFGRFDSIVGQGAARGHTGVHAARQGKCMHLSGEQPGLDGLDFDIRLEEVSQRESSGSFCAVAHTDALFQGPSRVYAAPYSAVVTWAFDLRTE